MRDRRFDVEGIIPSALAPQSAGPGVAADHPGVGAKEDEAGVLPHAPGVAAVLAMGVGAPFVPKAPGVGADAGVDP